MIKTSVNDDTSLTVDGFIKIVDIEIDTAFNAYIDTNDLSPCVHLRCDSDKEYIIPLTDIPDDCDIDPEELDEFMNDKSADDESLTNWEYFCNEWNKINYDNKIDFPSEQPSYKNLTDSIHGK